MKKSMLSGLFILALTTASPTLPINFSKIAKVVGLGSSALLHGIAAYQCSLASYQAWVPDRYWAIDKRDLSFERSFFPALTLDLAFLAFLSGRQLLKMLKK